jgi:hypothetical protein
VVIPPRTFLHEPTHLFYVTYQILRKTFFAFALSIFANNLTAAVFLENIGDDIHKNRIVVRKIENTGLVEIYDAHKLLGAYKNLVVSESTMSADIVSILDGGIAVSIDSNGSRYKYHIIAPIYKRENWLYINCVYKSIYDSVDETNSVGTSCKNISLGRFYPSTAINERDLFVYKPDNVWLSHLPLKDCGNKTGFRYGTYYVVQCEANQISSLGKPTVLVFNRSGKIILSFVGYTFIPKGDGDVFSLHSDLSDKTIIFYGSLNCISEYATHGRGREIGKIANKINSNYSIEKANGCYFGRSSYSDNNVPSGLSGMKSDNKLYLIERTDNGTASRLFILEKINDSMKGIWLSVPAGESLSVSGPTDVDGRF